MDTIRSVTLHPEYEGYTFEAGILGVNAEITRTGFFGGLCAEMLNNRKLYMGTNGVDGWECTDFTRILDHTEDSLCNSNYVILNGGSMSQTSKVIALNDNEDYVAKIWVKALSESATVAFGIDGSEKSFTVNSDDQPYRALSFVFKGKKTDNGTFIIRVSGNVAVFQASLLPVNNFYGMRLDVIEMLRAIQPASIRFPGGCAADHFDWKEGLKAPEFRKPADGTNKSWFLFRDTYHQDPFDIGINEFMMLCRTLGAEPEYTVSLILSDAEDAKNLVEYCNGDTSTKYGAIRESLGFDKFNVKLWYIGNEVFYFGEKYREDTSLAAKRTEELIHAVKEADPSLKVVIGVHWRPKAQDWSIGFLKNFNCPYDYVSFHDYTGDLTDETKGEKGKQTAEMLESNFIDGTSFGLEFYKNTLFGGSLEDIRICVDEWNYSWGQPNTTALFFSNAIQLHFLAKSKNKYHIDRAEFFMPVNEGMITVNGTEIKMEATGEMFKLFASHKGGRVINSTADPSLDVLSTDHGDHFFVSVVNRSGEDVKINVEGHRITAITEIKVNDYSFKSDDFEVITQNEPILHGHSMMFLTVI